MKQQEKLLKQAEAAELAEQVEVEAEAQLQPETEERKQGGQTITSNPQQTESEQKPSSEDGRKHILIIDDDPHMLKVLKHHLSGKYDVATAVSGPIALRFLQKKKTNLILLDYAMPQMDGPTVLEQLHTNPETKDIPVLFLTGASEKDKIQKALSLNPQGYLLKPVDQETLLKRIEDQIG